MCSFSWPEVYLLISTTNQRDYLTGQLVKNLLAMQETQVRFLGGKDPLEKEMATHSSIFAWEIPWTEKPGGAQESDTT